VELLIFQALEMTAGELMLPEACQSAVVDLTLAAVALA
jgi:hypothetical protein